MDNGQWTMDNGQLTIDNVEVFDIYGRKQKIIVNSQFSILNSIDVSHLASGVYFLKISNNSKTVVLKFVKE